MTLVMFESGIEPYNLPVESLVEPSIEPSVEAYKSLVEHLGATILTETYLFANFAFTAFHQLALTALCTCSVTARPTTPSA